MKRWIAFLLSFVMVLSLMPMAVMAEDAVEGPPITALYVGTVNALETPSGDGWSFNRETGVLTLNNCTLTESMLHVETYQDEEGNVYYDRRDSMIYFDGDLTIELIGTNSVERVVENAPGDYTNYYAICGSLDIPDGWDMPAALKFTGTGNLTVGIAVTADSLSEDGYNMNDAWDYFEFSAGIGVWGGVDLSGLYGGGWMDIYGGVYGVEGSPTARAFANYPTFGDNCIVTAYQDVEGTVENENGYNWNNNDAWRMKVVTADAYLKSNGQLILLDKGSASGEGWTWENSVLTLSENTEVKAVEFRRTVGSAKLTLTGDVTLDATDMGYDANWNSISAVAAYCDLEIDAGDHTLTLHNSWADALRAELCDVTLSGGTVVTTNEGGYAINMIAGNLTIQNATFRSATEIYLTEGYDADYNTIPAGDAVLSGAVVVLESPITSYGALTVLSSDVTVTWGYDALYGNTAVTVRDSTLSIDASGHALTSNSVVTVDNCNLNLTAEEAVIYHGYYHYEGDDESNIPDTTRILLQNMDITQPENWSVQQKQTDSDYYIKYEVLVVDGDGNPATTLVATAAGNEHEHSYENGICSCGAKQTFTITWKNADGTVLEVDTVEYGVIPEYNGPTPTKIGVGYDYTFRCWSNGVQYVDITNFVITDDWTFTAVYTNTVHKHDLIFMDGDLELARKEFDYNKYIYASGLNTDAGNHFEKDCCTHTGWAYADGTAVSNFWMPDEDLVIYAVWDGPNHTLVDGTCSVCGLTEGMPEHTHFFVEGICACGKVQTFTVTWTNWDGTVLEVDTVEYGQIPEYNGEIPIKTDVGYDYTFSCWYQGNYPATFEAVTADLTFKAYYASVVHKHDLIFKDGTVELARKTLDYNKYTYASSLNSYAGNPTKACYTLTGWAYADGTAAGAFWMPDEDVVLYAVWDGPNHSWVDATCAAPKTCSGCGLTEGEALEHTYTEGVCSGCGAIQTFTVTWVNWDGTVLETDTVEYGTVPTYDGETPTRPNVGWDFRFYGWALSASGAEVTPGAATKDVTYYAKYTSTVHKHNLIFLDDDGVTELGRYETNYSKYIAASWLSTAAGNPTKACCILTGWTYADGSAVESFYMPDEDVIFVAVWDGPNHMDVDTDADHSCDVCGAESVTEHSYEAVVIAPTCTDAGYTTYACNCGDSYVADEVAALGHSYDAVVTAPTCTDAGYTIYTCNCGDSYVADEVAALGHSYDAVVTAPTCTEVGYTTYTCANCGDTYTADEVPALGHDRTTEIQYPTCTENGSITVTCGTCGEKLIGALAATGHSYENGSCTACGQADPNAVTRPTLTLKAPALEFKDMIKVVAFFTAENTEDVVEMGMITYTEKVDVIDISTAAHVIPGAEYEAGSGRYFASSQGIHGKYLGDTVYLACYAKLTDGSYVYTKLAGYGPLTYATNQLKSSTNVALKQLCAAMLNYGAAAQNYFAHNTDVLANATLTDEQKALPEAYREDMAVAVPAADAAKQGEFANNQGFSSRRPAVSFEGAFSINYFFTPKYAPVGEITLYYWTGADFAAADVLTAENASGSIVMDGEGMGQYRGDVVGIAAKDLSEAVYVAAVYSDGTTTWTSGVLGYSIGAYCSSMAKGTDAMADLAMATAVYGYHAKQYFGS